MVKTKNDRLGLWQDKDNSNHMKYNKCLLHTQEWQSRVRDMTRALLFLGRAFLPIEYSRLTSKGQLTKKITTGETVVKVIKVH